MAVTTLDPKTALVVIDLQKGIVAYPTVHPIAEVVKRAARWPMRSAAAACRSCSSTLPAERRAERNGRATANRFPPDGPTSSPRSTGSPSDIVVTKRTWGAFASTDLEDQLKALGVTQVVIAGVATGTGVESTARQAYEHGFNVTLAIDAMTDMRPEAHDYSIAQVFPRLGETGTTREIIDLLEHTRAQRSM